MIMFDETEFFEKMRESAKAHRSKRIAEAEQDPHLVCYGCAHAAADVAFPGQPSGERPCCFCVRNKSRQSWIERNVAAGDRHPVNGIWYDGSKAIHVPMDCYTTLDMLDQHAIWMGHDPDTTIRFG